ncbi:hypothetical protein NMY22_g12279 [Coprinellus aureogranulatus]|nr:hypothetical protein NMY22_g12279 [Coprinellus aureogranulatus]
MVSLDPFIGSTLNDRVLRLRGSLASPLLHAGNSLGHRRVEEVSSASDQTSASSSAPTGPSGLDGVLTRNARMHSRIRRLEKANAKLKERLEDRLDALKDARLEANQAQSDLMKIEDAHSELERAQEKLRTIEERAKVLKRDLKKFRRWWLTDYHSLKLVVSLLPESEDVVEIASSADARFASYSA